MAGYMLVLSDLDADRSWIADYIADVPRMIAAHGGEYVAVGNDVAVLEGTIACPDAVTLFKFPSVARIREFMDSDEYQPFKKMRQKWSTANILVFETPEA